MNNLIEITEDDIRRLTDADLRDLIGMLCEADYRLAGLSTRGITYGGNQNAGDGGLDVRVQDNVLPPSQSFVPKSQTGIQVKIEKMPDSKIKEEMRPNGILRDSIKNLIRAEGAYIIVSSGDSLSDTMLERRIKSIKDAVNDEVGHENLIIQFYDCKRIATWVRLHYSIILWVRHKVGRPLEGWYPYDNWSKTPGGIAEEYLLDDKLRLYDESSVDNQQSSVVTGLQKIRSQLSVGGNSLRLVGHSGVGKTRLAQALFDSRVGSFALNPAQVFYTDVAYSPNPNPRVVIEQLIAEKIKMVIIVDNCPPDLHRILTSTCCASNSTVSLMTVEYDVHDDSPEDTAVFRLEPGSEDLVAKMVRKRYRHISQVDAETIARFSEGNARIAISLADTAKKGETLCGLQDEDLFKRLFQQRTMTDESLYVSAEALSLVYSFEATDLESETSEIKLLASLVNKTGDDLYRDISKLIAKGLIQTRGRWKAILPPAISNRLGKRALAAIEKKRITDLFIGSGSERIIKSFARRLGYLHDHKIAVEIVSDWLLPEGWLGKLNCNFNIFGMQVFRNIAPLVPEKILIAMEEAEKSRGDQFTSRDNNRNYYDFVCILWHLSFDQVLFKRCAKLMCLFAVSEKMNENRNSIRSRLTSLFYIYFSGTNGTVEQRAEIIEELLASSDQRERELALQLLDASLETSFTSSYSFDFGARPRNYGYHPKTKEDITFWYEKFINICTQLAVSSSPLSNQARNILAKNFRELWKRALVFDCMEKAAVQIHGHREWHEGWLSVREAMLNDKEVLCKHVLEKIENALRPADLVTIARVCIFTPRHKAFSIDDDFHIIHDLSCRLKKTEEYVKRIGVEVAKDAGVFEALLPDLFSSRVARSDSLGKGLAEGFDDKMKLWEKLYSHVCQIPLGELKRIDVLLGFLSSCAISDRDSYNRILDGLVEDRILGKWLPIMETQSVIDQQGLKRLCRALDTDNIEIGHFKYIGYGRAHESLNDDELSNLLDKILTKSGGVKVAIDILHMRFDKNDERFLPYSIKLVQTARKVLALYSFPEENSHDHPDYALSKIVKVGLCSGGGMDVAKQMGENFKKSMIDGNIQAFDFPNLLNSFAGTQPAVFLDTFIQDEIVGCHFKRHVFFTLGNPVDEISESELIAWCEIDPDNRYPKISSIVTLFLESGDSASQVSLNPIIHALFKHTSSLSHVLESLFAQVWNTSGSGARSDILQRRLSALSSLRDHEISDVGSWAKEVSSSLKDTISQELKAVTESNCQYWSFE